MPLSIDLSPELESLIAEELRSGHFKSPVDLIETALYQLLKQSPVHEGKFRGTPHPGDEEILRELRSRRGSWA